MSLRVCVLALLILACLGGFGVVTQHRQLGALKEQKGQVLAQLSGPLDAPSASTSNSWEPDKSGSADTGSASALSELLQLRRQVAQLTDRQRELAGARAENEQLRAQLAQRGTNAPGAAALPPDYIRKSSARWVGLNTPENTLQSFLWAVQARDVTNLLQVLTPESGAQLARQIGNSPDQFFEQSADLPGMRIAGRRTLPDGSIELNVEIMPGSPVPGPIHLRQIDGDWKLDLR